MPPPSVETANILLRIAYDARTTVDETGLNEAVLAHVIAALETATRTGETTVLEDPNLARRVRMVVEKSSFRESPRIKTILDQLGPPKHPFGSSGILESPEAFTAGQNPSGEKTGVSHSMTIPAENAESYYDIEFEKFAIVFIPNAPNSTIAVGVFGDQLAGVNLGAGVMPWGRPNPLAISPPEIKIDGQRVLLTLKKLPAIEKPTGYKYYWSGTATYSARQGAVVEIMSPEHGGMARSGDSYIEHRSPAKPDEGNRTNEDPRRLRAIFEACKNERMDSTEFLRAAKEYLERALGSHQTDAQVLDHLTMRSTVAEGIGSLRSELVSLAADGDEASFREVVDDIIRIRSEAMRGRTWKGMTEKNGAQKPPVGRWGK